MSVKDDCPLLSLPDELVGLIFSHITDISFKLQLESVCKRFERISTTQTSSWKGNDKLELVAGCYTLSSVGPNLTNYLADCPRYINRVVNLNGCGLSVNKWPKAIEQLLQRTVVRKLCIHIAGRFLSPEPDKDLRVLHGVFELLQSYSGRIRLTYIEYHRQFNGFENAYQQLPEDMYLWAASGSVKTLESVVLLMEDLPSFSEEKWTQLCSGLEACNGLKSFSIQINPAFHNLGHFTQLIAALRGKPLNSVSVDGQQEPGSAAGLDLLTEFVLPICENARGDGITSLKTTLPHNSPHGLVDFANNIHPPTTQSLVELWISNASINRVLPDLNHLPATFPNLKELHLVTLYDPDLDEALLLNTQFFTVCDETPLVDRKVFVSCLGIEDEDEFRAGITNFCEEQGVQAVFGNGEEQSWLTLNKGRGTIEIGRIQEPTLDLDLLSEYGYDMDDFFDYDEEYYEDEDGDYEFGGDHEDDDYYP